MAENVEKGNMAVNVEKGNTGQFTKPGVELN